MTSWLGATLLVLAPTSTTAQADPDPADAATDGADGSGAAEAGSERGDAPTALRVAVAGSAPFVMGDDDGELQGFSLDVWKALAGETPRTANSDLTLYPTVDAALEAVQDDAADVALGPISITADRAARLGFSQPYYHSALSILAPATESLWSRLAPFATRAFGAGLLLLFFVLGVVGTLLWLSERRENPQQFPQKPVPGIANGIWLALVTMTTVGYGDLAPRTRAGRVVAGGWMVIAMITASSLTASIATALTLSQLDAPGISKASHLDGHPIAVLEPSPAAEFVRASGGRLHRVSSVEEGVQSVLSGEASAMVWDRAVLAYYLRGHTESALSLSDAKYQRRGYGIAARHADRDLLRVLDLGILRLLENGDLDRLSRRWLDE